LCEWDVREHIPEEREKNHKGVINQVNYNLQEEEEEEKE
jgi:hypothetical protein